MESTLTRGTVLETLDAVLNALALYEERDEAIEQLELRINADRAKLVVEGD